MNSNPRNFDALRRVLALKRHEVPPPGYFNSFSSQIIARIEAGELGESKSWMGRWLGDAPWLQRLRSILEAQPAFAGVFGAGACALLITGILYTENSGQPGSPLATPLIAGETMPTFEGATSLTPNTPMESMQLVSSTNPVAPATASLFDQFQLSPVRASYTIQGN